MRTTNNPADFNAAFNRFHEAANTRTQIELAEVLGIRQSSISDAKRRQSIPADWYLEMFRQFGTNPIWLETGKGPKFLKGTDDEPIFVHKPLDPGEVPPEETVEKLQDKLRAKLGHFILISGDLSVVGIDQEEEADGFRTALEKLAGRRPVDPSECNVNLIDLASNALDEADKRRAGQSGSTLMK